MGGGAREDGGNLMERGETEALLDKQGKGRGYKPYELSDSDLEKPLILHRHKPSDWKAPFVILFIECLDSTAFFGIATNLVMYLTSVLHESNSESVTSTATWMGTSFMTPLLGAFVADTVLGSYKTTFVSVLLYLLGMVIITFSALLPSLQHSALTSLPQSTVFYFGLYMVAFGSGGVKSSLLPLGADQFDDDNPADTERKASFIGWFYVCLSFGMFSSGTVIVWIQQNVSWLWGYGITTTCIALVFVFFVLGTPLFRRRQPSGSPLKSILQVVVASCRKISLRVPSDSTLLYEAATASDDQPQQQQQQRLTHTEEFSFLDRAAVVEGLDELLVCGTAKKHSNTSWRLCTVTQVEELKTLLRMVPVWLTSVVYSVAYCQITQTFIEQGEAMDTMVGSFSVPPAMLPAIELLFVIFWTTVYDSVIVPATRKYTDNPRGLSTLQRMGAGRFLMILTMATAAFMETKRLQASAGANTLSITWQLPQYILIAASEALNYIGQLEFFYDQSPESMKSLGTAIYMLSIAAGNYVSSMVVTLAQGITSSGGRPGWIPDNLNNGHLDYFFWLLAAFSAFNFVAHIYTSRGYTLKKVA